MMSGLDRYPTTRGQAPVPFLVGIHSRYLQEMGSGKRPEGVVFVDLDNDKIYLGLDEDM